MKKEDNNQLPQWYKKGIFIAEISIVIACTIGIITCAILTCSHRSYEKELKLIFSPNSTVCMTNSLEAVENNLKTYIDDHERLLEERYNTFLKNKEQDTQIVTLSSILVSIVLALFGFLGYKNMKDIEQKAIYIAEETARKRTVSLVEENLESLATTLIDEKMTGVFYDLMKKNLEKGIEESIFRRDLDNWKQYLLQDIDEYVSDKCDECREYLMNNDVTNKSEEEDAEDSENNEDDNNNENDSSSKNPELDF